jgi:hypothetical protein
VKGVPPFHLEATIAVDEQSGGYDLPASSLWVEHSSGVLRWWYIDADHWRWEYEQRQPAIDAGVTVVWVNGAVTRTYDSRTNTYQDAPTFRPPDGQVFAPSAIRWVGPVPYPDQAAFVQAFTADGRVDVQLAGNESLLGRRVAVIDSAPAVITSAASSSGTSGTQGIGTARTWLDADRMFVLKTVVDLGNGLGHTFVVTKLDYDAAIARDATRYPMPADAQASDSDGGSDNAFAGGISRGTGGSGKMTPVPGFLVADVLPKGFSERGTQSGGNDSSASLFDGMDGSGSSLRIDQRRRAGGLPPAAVSGDPVDIGGRHVFRERIGDTVHILFSDGDLAVAITAEGIADTDLEAFVASLHLVP